MSESPVTFDEALKEAQLLGFAEADPTLDVEGFDTAHKAVVLAALAYGFWAKPDSVPVQGIRGLDVEEFGYAKLLGYTIKLLAVIKADESGAVDLRVHPTLVPNDHVLASVEGGFNAVALRGDVVGDTLFYGKGAGGDATASAVISDMVDAALRLERGASLLTGEKPSSMFLKPASEAVSRRYVRFIVRDQPGVLAAVAAEFGKQNVGISSVFQPGRSNENGVPLVMLIHDATEQAFSKAMEAINKLDVVLGDAVVLPVEDFEL